MDGRVKTLHPKIHGGILARRAHPEDLEAARAHDRCDTVLQAEPHVAQDGARMGEVDGHLHTRVDQVLDRVAHVHLRHQFQAVGFLDRPAHLRAHPTPRTQHSHRDPVHGWQRRAGWCTRLDKGGPGRSA